MNVSTQIEGERIAKAIVERATAQEILARNERSPHSFMVALSVLFFALSTSLVALHFGTPLEAFMGALSGAAFALALASYSNGMRQTRRLRAMLRVMNETAP